MCALRVQCLFLLSHHRIKRLYVLRHIRYYLFDNQEGLYEINGVYDENTANAVMRLQSDYKDKYHLNVSCVFDSETKDCLINI